MQSPYDSRNILDVLTNGSFLKPVNIDTASQAIEDDSEQPEKRQKKPVASIDKIHQQLAECQFRKTQIESIKKKVNIADLQGTKQLLTTAYIDILLKDEEQIEQQLELQRVEKRQKIVENQRSQQQRQLAQINKMKSQFANYSSQRPTQSRQQKVRYVGVQEKQLTEEEYSKKYGLQISQKKLDSLRIQKYQQMYMMLMQQYQKVLDLAYVQRPQQNVTNLYRVLQNNQFRTLRVSQTFKRELDKFVSFADGVLKYCSDRSSLTDKIDQMMQQITIQYT